MQKIGLYFGSFNPIHIGHLALANYMTAFEEVDEVWFVVSPQNPFKQNSDLAPTAHRIEMVSLATKDHPQLKAEDIELSLPTPSYTIDTLRALEQKHPDYRFTIIMGADNIAQIDRWKEAESVTNYNILVYPRPDYPTDQLDLPELCKITDAPLIEIASSDIRMWLKDGKQVACFMPAGVFDYIQKNKVY